MKFNHSKENNITADHLQKIHEKLFSILEFYCESMRFRRSAFQTYYFQECTTLQWQKSDDLDKKSVFEKGPKHAKRTGFFSINIPLHI